MVLPEELLFLVIKAVDDDVSLDDLLTELGEIDDGLIRFVRNSYESELLKSVKAAIKARMTELVVANDAEFINSARNEPLLNTACFSNFTQKLIHNHIDLTDKRLNSWNDDFRTFYNLLENRFVSISNEAKLMNVIVEWFDTGEMSLDVWKAWWKWFQICTENDNAITLESLRQVQWPPSLPKDTVICKFVDALRSIDTDDFLDKGKLTKLLKLLLEEPLIKTGTHVYADKEGNTLKTETRTLNVYGRTIYLSTIRNRLEAEMKSMKQIDIIVRSTLFLDCDLTDSVWQGKNIAIVADKVNVCGERVIDVSAISDSNNIVKRAMNGTNGSETKAAKNGHDGRDGRAGESSGSITIAASDMSNPEQLTLKLVGGDGDNGESGGNGGDGVDGKGIDKVEFDEIFVKYKSSDDWSLFENYQPPGNWNKTVDKKCSGVYIHYVFKDDHGRELHYDFSKNNGERDLLFLVKGTDGTSGGIGGLNGKGGEGGNMGECIVINPESDLEYPVNKIQRNGNDGLDGEVGEYGKPGINGNDMAVIDRLADGRKGQHFYGRGQTNRLQLSYHYDYGEYRRFICYRKLSENKRDCYVEVSYGEPIHGYLRQYERQKKEERSSEAQMKMKQSIVWSQLMHKAQEHRNKVDYSMNIATVSMHADKFETFKTGDEVESVKVTEVQQEVLLLKEVENDLYHGINANVQQHKRSPKQFVKTISLNSEMKSLGEVGYYIIYLRQQKKEEEAFALNAMLTKENVVYHIPEKLIAQLCFLIAGGEIKFNVALFTRLMEKVTEKSGIPNTGKTQLVTDEAQQRQMISNVVNTEAYEKLFSEKPRYFNDIATLIEVIGKADKDKVNKSSMNKMRILNNDSKETVKLLNKIDSCIFKLRKVRLRDAQRMAVIYAVEKKKNLLSQVNTGEGKSYIIAAIAIIGAKMGFKFVDIITSSPVLAQRDATEMSDIYEAMGVTVDHNCSENMDERKLAYKAQIVYGDMARFQSDYLLHDFYRKNILGERDRSKSCVIVDEVDSMMLDNGNNMLYLSHNIPGMHLLEPLFVHIQRIIFSVNVQQDGDKAFDTNTIEHQVLSDLLGHLEKEDILKLAVSDEEKKNTFFTLSNHVTDKDGYLLIDTDSEFQSRESEITMYLQKATTKNHAMKILACIKAVINRPREIEIPRYLIPFVRRHLTEYIENAKRAFFMKQNEAYVVDTDRTGTDSDLTPKVTIIDQHTGVDLPTTQWGGGLQQFIQIKHGCRVDPVSLQAIFVSNVNYLKGYKKINGLSGTLGSDAESKTLVKLYDAELIKFPTFQIRQFSEYIPVITDSKDKWLDALFDQVTNQVNAQRSVLVICQTISNVITIKDGLLRRYNDLVDTKKSTMTCFKHDNLIVYKREHDTLKVVDYELEPGRLILATNLAGRGSDIKLSESLKDAGGLHVIVSFLPENERIEEQAYGRAARCGDPGSGQIIAFSNETNATGNPLRVFDFKLFRDIAEGQRLKSLMDHYREHIKVKENCLSAFKERYRQMNNSKGKDGVLSEAEIIYFALLDEWALWLDSGVLTNVRYKNKMNRLLNEFIKNHPIEDPLTWINCPYLLIALGVCRIYQEKTAEAKKILNKVIKKFPEFSGDGSYYLGIMAQKDVRKVKPTPAVKSADRKWFIKTVCEHVPEMVNQLDTLGADTLKAVKDKLPDIICDIDDVKRIETEDYLLQAIQGFNRRIELKQKLATIISRLQIGPEVVKSKGFQHQTEELTNVYNALIDSAYDMIGYPMSFANFANGSNDIEEQFKAHKMFLQCLNEGYITGKAVNHNIMDDQCEHLRKKYMLSKTKLHSMFKEMVNKNNKFRIQVYGRTYLQESVIRKQCPLPNRDEFWGFLASSSCFNEHQEFYVLNTEGVSGTIEELQTLATMSPPEPSPLRIQLSDFDLSTKQLYDAVEVEKAFEDDEVKLKWLIEMEYLIKDATAVVDRDNLEESILMPRFDYFTADDLAEWLEMDNAEWIVDMLLQSGTLQGTDRTDSDQRHTKYIYQSDDKLDCSALPECLQSTVKAFLYHSFAYTFAFTALRRSLDLAAAHPETKKPIMLAWKPHAALIKDLIKYGFIHDHKFELRDRVYMERAVKKRLEEIERRYKPRLFVRSGHLMSTKQYFKQSDVNAAANVQVQAIQHIRHVGIIEDINASSIVPCLNFTFTSSMPYMVPTLFMTTDFASNFMAGFLTSLLVTATSRSMLYFLQSVKAKYSTQKNSELPIERYTRVLHFYSHDVQVNENSIKSYKLTKTAMSSINLQLTDLFKGQVLFLHRWRPDMPKVAETSMHFPIQQRIQEMLSKLNGSKLGPRRFTRLVHLFLDQPHNWRMYRETVQDILIRNKPALLKKCYETLNGSKIDNRIDLEKSDFDENLLTSLLCKIIEDAAFMLDERNNAERSVSQLMQFGEDPIPDAVPDEYVKLEFEDIESDNDSEDADNDLSSDDITDDNIDKEKGKAVTIFISKLSSQVKNIVGTEVNNVVWRPALSMFNEYIQAVSANSKNHSSEFVEFFEKEVSRKHAFECRNKEILLQKRLFDAFTDE